MHATTPSRAALYRLIWRWHFYAGLFCIPFILALSLTGSVYLFRPQIDAWLDSPYNQVDANATRLPPSEQVRAALAAVPGARLNAYQLPEGPHDAAQVLVGSGESLYRVYVDPSSAQVLHKVAEDQRFSRLLFHLHGELLMGRLGSLLVELAACWTVLLLVTGLYLWWPRGSRLGGVLYPRPGQRGRLFWRDLHGVTGFWVSLLALLLILSGLPWATFWGGALKQVRQWSAQHAVQQDWTTGRAEEMSRRRAQNTAPGDEHANMPGMRQAMPDMPGMPAMPPAAPDYASLDRMLPTVRALNLPAPVLLAPPSGMAAQWTARSDAANRPQRVNLVLDAQSGAVLERVDFAQRPLLDRVIGYGVAAHEGQLFGWANQALGLFTTLGLVCLALSALVLWWRRRPQGLLGAPAALGGARYPAPAFAVLVLLGLYLPLLGASLLLVWLLERCLLSRIAPLARFLGLGRYSASATG
ncbi:PepSY-associated TM helix domain-containing protein [Pseudomonas citronellolis]|uniref:PepSY-associated TM helix domain-containing protein n=1 Tax=Pseudomonas citronellolis TaxID=53408 RepID=UPI0023E3BFF4|nr:PepSY domain-containing protein [Pseudomonas citronellolis]MDF3931135.1 PepSY domain-containing protein [Pseudomonas citronellolis]